MCCIFPCIPSVIWACIGANHVVSCVVLTGHCHITPLWAQRMINVVYNNQVYHIIILHQCQCNPDISIGCWHLLLWNEFISFLCFPHLTTIPLSSKRGVSCRVNYGEGAYDIVGHYCRESLWRTWRSVEFWSSLENYNKCQILNKLFKLLNSISTTAVTLEWYDNSPVQLYSNALLLLIVAALVLSLLFHQQHMKLKLAPFFRVIKKQQRIYNEQ